MSIGEIIGIVIVALIVLGAVFEWILEYYEYNHGVCRKCGHKLRSFDTDSQGGTGYTCDKCDNSFWISYPVD